MAALRRHLLIAFSVVVGCVSMLGGDRTVVTWLRFSHLKEFVGSISSDFSCVMRGQIWRLITPISVPYALIHIHIRIHIHMLWLKDLAGAIECH